MTSPMIKSNCTGCGHCVAACALNAMTLETEQPNGFGPKRALVDPKRCCGCRACEVACPHAAISFDP